MINQYRKRSITKLYLLRKPFSLGLKRRFWYRPNRRNWRGRQKIDWMVVFTGVLALVGAISALVSLGQWSAIRGQLDAMQADQRPWIQVDVTVGGELDLRAGWGILPLNYKIKNIGRSPATAVRVGAWRFTGKNPFGGLLFDALDRDCQAFSRRPVVEAEQAWTVFPNDEIPPDGRFESASVGIIPAQVAVEGQAQPNGSIDVPFWFYGCVDYTFGEPAVHHQTGFVFEAYDLVQSLGETAKVALFPVGQVTDADKIRLEKRPFPGTMIN